VSAEAIRFEVTVTNNGTTTADLGYLGVEVRTGPEGRPADQAWDGTRSLGGKLLPGASATGIYNFRILADTAAEIDISVSWGRYSSDKVVQVWSGEAVHGLYDTDLDPTAAAQEQHENLYAEAMAELDAMTGLAPVKRRVRIIGAQARMSAVRARHGLRGSGAAHHLVFSGHPGTGKTAVARLLGKVFAGAGLLAKGHLVEAHRVDLIGEHLGHTGAKTSKLIDRALDGVLFIDEAYGLHGGYEGSNGDAFGDEALQVLLKRAEDDRHRLVVILAGYGPEITRLLSANPGLASRFPTRVDFPSYDAAELTAIARGMLKSGGDALTAKAAAELKHICAQVEANGWQDILGNGRFARTLVEQARAARDLRLATRHPDCDPPLRQLTQLSGPDLTSAFADLRAGYGLTATLARPLTGRVVGARAV
jgi:type VII secretion ATPase EccA